MMQGTNIDFIKEIASSTKKPITAAGGISTIEEIVDTLNNQRNAILRYEYELNKLKKENNQLKNKLECQIK